MVEESGGTEPFAVFSQILILAEWVLKPRTFPFFSNYKKKREKAKEKEKSSGGGVNNDSP
jgi:hypothetical protein